jgi:formiminoglutamase
MKLDIDIFDQARLETYVSKRAGETKAGQSLKLLGSTDPNKFARSLADLKKSGVRYAIMLIPEDIGPRANLGRPGADEAPEAFLKYFLNVQANRFFEFDKLCLIGNVALTDLIKEANELKPSQIDEMRTLCARVDERVVPIISEIAKAGFEPIVIGGGNNNSFPTLKGLAEAFNEQRAGTSFSVVNCDPHADFRIIEGRHSGNPFTYAHEAGLLKKYCVLGLHENYNSEDMLTRLDEADFRYFHYEDFAVRQESAFEEEVMAAIDYLSDGEFVGCELDIDGIADVPSSAMTPFGISPEQAAYYIHAIAASLNVRYLHLSEGAPKCVTDDGSRRVGKILTLMVVTYLKAREDYLSNQVPSLGKDEANVCERGSK